MNIDFPSPSSGTYNNAGSSRRLADYLEHEDLERMEKGIYTEGFFNLTEDDLYKSQVVRDIDNNKAQLLKTDAKFYAIHVSPSAKELETMGKTEEEQAKAMKRYIREVFIPEYAKNFNKDLSAKDIKFYGKIHFDRERSENDGGNMHCHIIVSRKDESNKIKISPLTNHRSTKKGVIKGGFDRKTLFQEVEKSFDELFNHNRKLEESFEYYNIMKNGSIEEQLEMQNQQLSHERKNAEVQIGLHADVQERIADVNQTSKDVDLSADMPESKFISTYENTQESISADLGLTSALGIFAPEVHGEDWENEDFVRKKKLEQKRRGRRL